MLFRRLESKDAIRTKLLGFAPFSFLFYNLMNPIPVIANQCLFLCVRPAFDLTFTQESVMLGWKLGPPNQIDWQA